MNRLVYLAFGVGFGFILHQSRVSDYDTILALLRLKDFHAMGVLGVGIATSTLGLFVLRRSRVGAALGGPIELHPKPMRKGILFGSLLFGAGWGLTGTCPGTALAQIGEGKLFGLATLAGLLAGTLAYGVLEGRSLETPKPKQSATSAPPSLALKNPGPQGP
jgi:uncharacterized membrane protein YedE/YeeE